MKIKPDPIDGWYTRKGYIHFDAVLPFEKAKSYVEDPEKVAKHGFLPYIFYEQMTPKHSIEGGRITTKKKPRPISYPSHLDGYILSYYCKILSDLYEQRLTDLGIYDVVSAFRRLGKSNGEFARDAFSEILKRDECSALTLDFSGFFDNIDHRLLKKKWAGLLTTATLPPDHYAVFKNITKYSRCNQSDIYETFDVKRSNPSEMREITKKGRVFKVPTRKSICKNIRELRNFINNTKKVYKNKESFGIPQGSQISAFLSNLYMIDFDKELHDYVSGMGGFYRRYCDDIFLIVPTDRYNEVIDKCMELTSISKSTINETKTTISHFKRDEITGEMIVSGDKTGRAVDDSGILQYLGFCFDGKSVVIRPESYNRSTIKMKSGVKLAVKTKRKHDAIKVSKGLKPSEGLKKRKLLLAYGHRGARNFPAYAMRMAKIMEGYVRDKETGDWVHTYDTGLTGGALRRQVSNANVRLNKEIKTHLKLLSQRKAPYGVGRKGKTNYEERLTQQMFDSLYPNKGK